MGACHGIFKLNTKGFYTQNGAGEVGGGLWEYYYNIEYEMRNLLCVPRRILLRNCSEPKLHRAEIAVRNCVPDTSRVKYFFLNFGPFLLQRYLHLQNTFNPMPPRRDSILQLLPEILNWSEIW